MQRHVAANFRTFHSLRHVLAGCASFISGCASLATSGPETELPPLSLQHSERVCDASRPKAINPLVTEWPASEKAHLESLSAERVVAVRYVGCELQVVGACVLPGSYNWRQTTPATDTLEISNADELYTKLPIGAFGLEGELARSGKLAVQTTVAGQLRLSDAVPLETLPPECHAATHYVEAISIGSFKLFSGNDAKLAATADIAAAQAGASRSSNRVTLREAGDPAACANSSVEQPDARCASPLQLFLRELGARTPTTLAPTQPIVVSPTPNATGAQGSTGVYVNFPQAADGDVWTLRGRSGEPLCTLPCGAWLEVMSGAYLQRERPRAEVRIPGALPHRLGSHVRAEFNAQRGEPTLSKWTFYLLGAPSLLMSGIVGISGAVEHAAGCDDSSSADFDDQCTFSSDFVLGAVIGYGLLGGASMWWWLWSEEASFETYEELGSAPPETHFSVGPGWVRGTF